MPVALTVAAPVVSQHSFKTALTASERQWSVLALWHVSGQQDAFQVQGWNFVLFTWKNGLPGNKTSIYYYHCHHFKYRYHHLKLKYPHSTWCISCRREAECVVLASQSCSQVKNTKLPENCFDIFGLIWIIPLPNEPSCRFPPLLKSRVDLRLDNCDFWTTIPAVIKSITAPERLISSDPGEHIWL